MSLVVYSAASRVHDFRTVIRDMARGLRDSRYVAYRLARNSIVSSYSQSVLGFLWDFVDPLVLGLIFYFLRQGNVFQTDPMSMPYSVFVLYGLLMFQTFNQATIQSLNVLQASRGLTTQQKLPPEALLLSIFFRVSFFTLFRISAMLIISLLTGAIAWAGVPWFILGQPLLILLGMAIGIFLAPFNAIYSDVGRFVNMILVPLRFISPVLFPLAGSMFEPTRYVNPFWTVMENLRLLAVHNSLAEPGLALIHLGVVLVIGLVGWFIFHVSVPILAERA